MLRFDHLFALLALVVLILQSQKALEALCIEPGRYENASTDGERDTEARYN